MLTLLLALFYFFYFAMVGVYIIFLPKVLDDLGYTSAQIGLIYAATPFVRFLVPFLFKKLFLGPGIYVGSLVATALITLLFLSSVEHFWIFLGVNLLYGAVMGIPLPYVDTIALTHISKERYGKVRLWGSVGFMAIALFLGKVLESNDEIFFYLSATATLTALFGIFVLRYDVQTAPIKDPTKRFSLLRYPYLWASFFLMQVAFGGFYNFFTIYATQQGISLETVTWLWSFGVACEIVMLYFQGPLLKRNLLLLLEVATAATALRWLLIWLFPGNLTMLFVAQSIHALSFALYHTAAISYIFRLYEEKKLAQQFFLGIAFGLGGSVGALVAGWLYGKDLFLYESLITLLALIMLFLHQKRRVQHA